MNEMHITTGTPHGIELIDYALDRAGWNADLFGILCKEGCDCYLTANGDDITLYVYTTVWEYEEPTEIKSNESLLQFVRDLVASSYADIEDYIPPEYHEIID